LSPERRYLYTVHGHGKVTDEPNGTVNAFAVDQRTGELTWLNRQTSYGTTPCHLTTDQTGRYLFVANFRGVGGVPSRGSVSAIRIEEDGRLGEATDVVQHPGSSVHPERQTASHPHSNTVDPSNRFVIVADLGIDRLMVYQLDLATGKLIPAERPSVEIAPETGPRHFAFHPSGKYAYVITEISDEIIVFSYDESRGALRQIQAVSTLPPDFEGRNMPADVQVLPSGKFVYGTNRGHDSIAIFAVDEHTGELRAAGYQPIDEGTPQNLALDPTGTFLLSANEKGNNVTVFRIDPQTGGLEDTGHRIEVPMPLCVHLVV